VKSVIDAVTGYSLHRMDIAGMERTCFTGSKDGNMKLRDVNAGGKGWNRIK
jgi:hypothetical protein